MKSVEGVLPAIITPFKPDYDIDETALREVVRRLIEEGVHGIVACGSTGEFALMSLEERMRVAEVVRDELSGNRSLVIGATCASTAECITVAKHSREINADAVLVAPPFYYANDEMELFAHYQQIAVQDVPIVVYNIPMTTKVDLRPEFLCRMASEIDQVRYVKDSKGNLADAVNLLKLAPHKLKLLLGADPMIYSYVLAGATGWISAPANIVPKQCVQLYNLMTDGRLSEAGALYSRLLPLLTYIYSSKFVQIAKAGVEMMGLRSGVPRRPLLPLPEVERETLRSILAEMSVL